MRGVVATVGKWPFDDAPTRQRDRFHDLVALLDHQRRHALRIPVHHVKLHRLTLEIGHPVSAIEQEDAIDFRRRGILLIVWEQERLSPVVATPGVQIGDAIQLSIPSSEMGVENTGFAVRGPSGLRPAFLNSNMRHTSVFVTCDFSYDFDVRAAALRRRWREDDITHSRGLSRLRVYFDDTIAVLRSMKAADIPDAALQRVAGVGRTDFTVVTLGVRHLTFQRLCVEHAVRILDRGQEGLQKDVKTDVAAFSFDARIWNPGVYLPHLELAASPWHSFGDRRPFDPRHDSRVGHRIILPACRRCDVRIVGSHRTSQHEENRQYVHASIEKISSCAYHDSAFDVNRGWAFRHLVISFTSLGVSSVRVRRKTPAGPLGWPV